MGTTIRTKFSALLLIMTFFVNLPFSFAVLSCYKDIGQQLKTENIKTKEKKVLFIIDDVEKVIEKSIMLKSLNKSDIVTIAIINKPTNEDISKYGEKAINGIIIIETINKKRK